MIQTQTKLRYFINDFGRLWERSVKTACVVSWRRFEGWERDLHTRRPNRQIWGCQTYNPDPTLCEIPSDRAMKIIEDYKEEF